MSGVSVDVSVPSPAALEGLLCRWPVECDVRGELNVSEGAQPFSSPILALVTAGPVWAQLPQNVVERIDAGDVLICHDAAAAAIGNMPIDDVASRWSSADHLRSPAMIDVRLDCIAAPLNPRMMPQPFIVRGGTSSIVGALGTALIDSVHSGAAVPVCNAVATALYLQCLDGHLQTRPRDVPMLSGLFDPEIGPVVTALLDSPARDWTVESLADVGGMSRSAFARKFRDLIGSAPIDFLVEVRMWQASRQLRHGSLDLKSIARQAGYQSPAAFSVAFKRWSGDTPSDYRRSS